MALAAPWLVRKPKKHDLGERNAMPNRVLVDRAR
jgi:hypothetical protein